MLLPCATLNTCCHVTYVTDCNILEHIFCLIPASTAIKYMCLPNWSHLSPVEKQQVAVSREYHSSLAIGLQLISPIAPHIASQLWEGKLREDACTTFTLTLSASQHAWFNAVTRVLQNTYPGHCSMPARKGCSACPGQK